MTGKRKVTLLLDEAVVERMRSAVERGFAPSQSAVVSEAVVEYGEKRRREELRRAYEEAANDPLFLEDIRTIQREFEPLDDEAWRDSAER